MSWEIGGREMSFCMLCQKRRRIMDWIAGWPWWLNNLFQQGVYRHQWCFEEVKQCALCLWKREPVLASSSPVLYYMQIEFHGILELWQWFTLPECAMDHLCTNSAVQTAALTWSLTHPCQITQNWKANSAPPLPDGSHTWLPSCLYLKGSAGLSVCLCVSLRLCAQGWKMSCPHVLLSVESSLFPCNDSLAWCTKQKQKTKNLETAPHQFSRYSQLERSYFPKRKCLQAEGSWLSTVPDH